MYLFTKSTLILFLRYLSMFQWALLFWYPDYTFVSRRVLYEGMNRCSACELNLKYTSENKNKILFSTFMRTPFVYKWISSLHKTGLYIFHEHPVGKQAKTMFSAFSKTLAEIHGYIATTKKC